MQLKNSADKFSDLKFTKIWQLLLNTQIITNRPNKLCRTLLMFKFSQNIRIGSTWNFENIIYSAL